MTAPIPAPIPAPVPARGPPSPPDPSPTDPSPADPALTDLAADGDRHDLENLGRFLEFSRVYGDGVDLEAVLDRVIDVAMEITEAERGSLILVRPGDRLEFRVVRERGKGAMPREGYRVSETIVREVISRGQPRIVSDIAHDADLSAVKSVVSLQLGSAAAMPLWRFALVESGRRARSTDEVFGVLYLDSQVRRDAFSRFDIGMLENLARDASSMSSILLRNSGRNVRFNSLSTAAFNSRISFFSWRAKPMAWRWNL
ncbi:MAG: GAF domain-containing protein, partial [Planctomycetota bacterium]